MNSLKIFARSYENSNKMEDKKYWTQIVLVYYPNGKAIYDLGSSLKYRNEMFKNKEGSTKDVLVYGTEPVIDSRNHWLTTKMRSKL